MFIITTIATRSIFFFVNVSTNWQANMTNITVKGVIFVTICTNFGVNSLENGRFLVNFSPIEI